VEIPALRQPVGWYIVKRCVQLTWLPLLLECAADQRDEHKNTPRGACSRKCTRAIWDLPSAGGGGGKGAPINWFTVRHWQWHITDRQTDWLHGPGGGSQASFLFKLDSL